EVIAQGPGVGLVDQQPMRHEEAAMGAPRVDAEAPLAADPLHVLLVEDFEREAEAALEFLFPLEQHRRGAGNDNLADLLPQQELPSNKTGFDRLAEADVVGDEQVDPWQQERLAERLQLVGIEA